MILALFALALIFYLALSSQRDPANAPVCEIVYDGQLVRTVPLDQDGVFSIDELPNVVFEAKEGEIAFIRSDCPDKVCILSGYLHTPGQMAACLPNRVAIRIASGSGETPDVVI